MLDGPKDTVDIEVKENVLTVKSKKLEDNSEDEHIYRVISTRSFERSWTLNDEVKVKASLSSKTVLLEISMVREIPRR